MCVCACARTRPAIAPGRPAPCRNVRPAASVREQASPLRCLRLSPLAGSLQKLFAAEAAATSPDPRGLCASPPPPTGNRGQDGWSLTPLSRKPHPVEAGDFCLKNRSLPRRPPACSREGSFQTGVRPPHPLQPPEPGSVSGELAILPSPQQASHEERAPQGRPAASAECVHSH